MILMEIIDEEEIDSIDDVKENYLDESSDEG